MEITIGKNIKELRQRKGLTQERLASYLGVSFQAISKWENGETYPDICILPAIASFFNVTTDYLLCVDKSKRDDEVRAYIEKYESLWAEKRYDEVKKVMKKATEAFPGEFTLLVRYLNSLIWCSYDEKNAVASRGEIEDIYTMIQSNCTVDSIRIWAKNLVCRYYFRLASIENSGISFDEVKSILSEMPLMQNSRDYLSCIYSTSENEREAAVKNLVNEAVYLMCRAVIGLCNDSKENENYKISAYKSIAHILEAVYPDGDFGKSYINATMIYAKLADCLRKSGKNTEAEKYISLSRETAQRFDTSDNILFHTSPLVAGYTVQKSKIPMAQGDPLSVRIENFI